MHTNQTGKMRKHIMMFVSTKINKKTAKLILLCIWVLKQMQEKLLLDHSNDRDRERTKKEEGNRKRHRGGHRYRRVSKSRYDPQV